MEKRHFAQEDLISRIYRPSQLEQALHELSPKPPEVIKAILVNY